MYYIFDASWAIGYIFLLECGYIYRIVTTNFENDIMLQQILLIDDDAINNFLNERIISLSGVAKEVKTFTTAEDGIHYLDSWCVQQRNKCPELILLDISMPRLDGFDFIQIFNKLKFKKEDTTIALLTSSQDSRDINK